MYDDIRTLLSTFSVVHDDATVEEKHYFLQQSLNANQAVADFVAGRLDLETFLDLMEIAGVDIDSYGVIVEDFTTLVGVP